MHFDNFYLIVAIRRFIASAINNQMFWGVSAPFGSAQGPEILVR